ncbi:MAG: sigma-70 family RNA polymerase sigma factor [Omnitrophica WOR_2 bacterium]
MTYPDKHVRSSETLSALLEKADVQGYLTPEDITEVYAWGEEDDARLNDLMTVLREQGVEISDDAIEFNVESEGFVDSGPSLNLEPIATEDTVGLYLKEMSRVPLLSVEEEINLAKRIEQGRIIRSARTGSNGRNGSKPRIDQDAVVQDAILAREHLIKANTRLVVSIAKKYVGRGVPFLDLIQEGNLGLMKSIEKFDYRRGFRFSTYATWWIRQTITRAIADQGRTIRVPVHMTDRIRQMYKVAHEMEQKLGRPATIEELAEEMKIEPRKLNWMQQVSWVPLSLESPVGDDEDSEFGMFVEDDITPTPSQTAYENMLREKVEEVLNTLSPREARILRLRFGLDHDRPYTLEEVGQKFGLTRERIRQIEGKALRRLRHPCRARLLREYVDPAARTRLVDNPLDKSHSHN